MEYLGAGGQVVNSPNVNKGITALGININLNSYIENIKKKYYEPSKHSTPFQENITNINRTKNWRHSVMHQRKKKLLRNFHVPRKEKLLTKCHTSKKGKTSGKMSCLKNI